MAYLKNPYENEKDCGLWYILRSHMNKLIILIIEIKIQEMTFIACISLVACF